MLPRYESSRGKYRVVVVKGHPPTIAAKKEDSPYYVPQNVFIENAQDLVDLFVCIASVLNQIYETDRFPECFVRKADVSAPKKTEHQER